VLSRDPLKLAIPMMDICSAGKGQKEFRDADQDRPGSLV
jgi:hypothetical protein